MAKLQGKVAVITGGSAGIGLATAQKFATEGARVFIVGRRQLELDKAVALIGLNATAIRADVSKLEELDELYRQISAQAGVIDIVVASAGMVEHASLESVTAEHFDRTFDLNARGTFFTVQKALPLMTRGGAIVLIASGLHLKGFANHSTYAATKAALRSFVRTWAVEFKGRNIRVNTLSPGAIDTPILDLQFPTPQAKADAMRMFADMTPLGRLGRPEEMAAAALFLASDDSSFCTAMDLVADGGSTGI